MAKNWDFGAGRTKSVWEKKSHCHIMKIYILALFVLVTRYLLFFVVFSMTIEFDEKENVFELIK